MAMDQRKNSTWTDDPQRENAELNDRVSEDLSKTPVNAGGPGALGGGGSTPGLGIDEGIGSDLGPAGVGPGSEQTTGPPESPAAPQPRGSIGSLRRRYLEQLRKSPHLAPFLQGGHS